MRGLALCAGYDGIGLGLSLVEPSYRTVCVVEIEAFAAALLVDKMEAGALAPAPVWGDLGSFDGRRWRGCVDIVTAGFPCQPWSVAGKRKGTDDDRWLWPAICRVVRDVGPRYVLLENVPGLLAGGLGHVLGDLAALGFDAEWACVKASEVGAPHRRERVFVLADAGRGGEHAIEPEPESGRCGEAASGETRSRLADAEQSRRAAAGERRYEYAGPEPETRGRAAGLPCWPPGPGERDAWARVLAERPDLAPAVAYAGPANGQPERRGESEPEVARREEHAPGGGEQDHHGRRKEAAQPGVRRVAHGRPSRVDRLRALGNGVVPLQVARAYVELRERLMEVVA